MVQNIIQSIATKCYNYVSTIETASESFTWESVANYDQIYRELMEKFLNRPWGLVYQQAWSLTLKEKDTSVNKTPSFQLGNGKKNKNKKDKELCWCFNKGKCTYGENCRFDHSYPHCSKSGHSIANCQKEQAKDKENQESN